MELCYKFPWQKLSRNPTFFACCWNMGMENTFSLWIIYLINTCRVDPCAVCEFNKIPPTHIAASREENGEELLSILGEFTKIPDTARLVKLSVLMKMEKNPERFQNLLKTLPVDLVRISLRAYLQFVSHSEGEQHKCARIGDNFAASCQRREKRHCQNLAGIWVSFLVFAMISSLVKREVFKNPSHGKCP